MDTFKQMNKKSLPKHTISEARANTSALKQDRMATESEMLRFAHEQREIQRQVDAELAEQARLREEIHGLKNKAIEAQSDIASETKAIVRARREKRKLEQEIGAIENILEEKSFSGVNQSKKLEDLTNEIVLLRASDNRMKTILLNFANVLVGITEENEFEDYTWKSKLAQGKDTVGMRIRFDRLNMTSDLLREIYRPALTSLKQQFSRYPIVIEAKTKKKYGIVTCLDLVIKVGNRKSLNADLLP